MATPAEVVALTWNEVKTEFVGYGLTGPEFDGSSDVSDVPIGLRAPLSWGYAGGIGIFDVPSRGVSGVCNGDSGGPWMARIGKKLVYLGPLAVAAGLPCDRREEPEDTKAESPVASAHTDLIDQALAAIGEAPDSVPVTCIRGKNVVNECWSGQAWEFEVCSTVKRADLRQRVKGTKFKRVDRFVGSRHEDCDDSAPYLILFRGIQTTPNGRFKVNFPAQQGYQSFTLTFAVSVS